MDNMSYRIRHAYMGAHVMARIFSSEKGPDSTHAFGGTLMFRQNEWDNFKTLIEAGQENFPGSYVFVKFIDDTGTDNPTWEKKDRESEGIPDGIKKVEL